MVTELSGIQETKDLKIFKKLKLGLPECLEKVSVTYDSLHKFKNNVIVAGTAAPSELPLTYPLCNSCA